MMEELSEDFPSGPVSTWLGELQISQEEMNKIVLDYLLIEGYKDAAEKFREEASLTSVSLGESEGSLDNRIKIKEAIGEGRISEAVQMINDSHPQILDNDRYLHFLLLQQELIELIRNKDTEQALLFAQERLAEKGEEAPGVVLPELERTLALLVFERPEKSPFADLMHTSHRQKVGCEVNAALLQADNRQHVPKIERMVQLVLWSQEILDKKGVKYAKMTDITTGAISEPKVKKNNFPTEMHR